jgi:hypothetical protein
VLVAKSDNNRGYFSSREHVELNKDKRTHGSLADNKEVSGCSVLGMERLLFCLHI